MKKWTITGYSTALFSTWYFVDELGLLLDAGDGVVSALLQKSRKIGHVFISHADRDHVTGLLQLNQLNARPDFPRIHYPYDCRSFPALEQFSKQFDPHVTGTVWQALRAGDTVQIRDDMYVEAVRNNHVQADEHTFKSFGYRVYQLKNKLKPEYAKLSQEQVVDLIKVHGRGYITDQIRTNVLTYSGDTPVDDYNRWDNTEVLIHEATFMSRKEQEGLHPHGNKHSNLEVVMEMAATLNLGALVLGHFSSRYTHVEIDANI
ncbi:MAG: RNAse Z, partial [Sphingobacteriales bacterium]